MKPGSECSRKKPTGSGGSKKRWWVERTENRGAPRHPVGSKTAWGRPGQQNCWDPQSPQLRLPLPPRPNPCPAAVVAKATSEHRGAGHRPRGHCTGPSRPTWVPPPLQQKARRVLSREMARGRDGPSRAATTTTVPTSTTASRATCTHTSACVPSASPESHSHPGPPAGRSAVRLDWEGQGPMVSVGAQDQAGVHTGAREVFAECPSLQDWPWGPRSRSGAAPPMCSWLGPCQLDSRWPWARSGRAGPLPGLCAQVGAARGHSGTSGSPGGRVVTYGGSWSHEAGLTQSCTCQAATAHSTRKPGPGRGHQPGGTSRSLLVGRGSPPVRHGGL